MKISDLKRIEPFFGNWYLKELIDSSSLRYVIYRTEHGAIEYNMMKAFRIPGKEGKLAKAKGLEYDKVEAVIYYKKLITEIYDKVCKLEALSENDNLLSYHDHMIYQGEKEAGYDIFLRTELLPSLIDGIPVSALEQQDIIRMGQDLCDALKVCENYKILHGQLRPETVYLASNHSFKLGDFSLIPYWDMEKVFDADQHLNEFLAPEVYEGKPYDHRADLYSLGLILYLYFNDYKLPFLEFSYDVASLEQRKEGLRRRREAQELPKPCNATMELSKVIQKACDVNPNMRYQSAAEFRDALTAVSIFLDANPSHSKANSVHTREIYVENQVVNKVHNYGHLSSAKDLAYAKPKMQIPMGEKHKDHINGDHIKKDCINKNLMELDKLGSDKLEIDKLEIDKLEKEMTEKEVTNQIGMPLYFVLITLVIAASVFVIVSNMRLTKESNANTWGNQDQLSVEALDSSQGKEQLDHNRPDSSQEKEDVDVGGSDSSQGKEKVDAGGSDSSQVKEQVDLDRSRPSELVETPSLIPQSPSLIPESPNLIPESPSSGASWQPQDTEQVAAVDHEAQKEDELEVTKEEISIEIIGQKLWDLTQIQQLGQAFSIDLSNNQIKDIRALAKAKQARYLVLSNNQIDNIDSLADMTQLHVLELSSNKVSSLYALTKLENLEVLSANKNMLTDLSGIENMKKLRVLYMQGNSIEDISILLGFEKLELIDLRNNKVKKEDILQLKKNFPECIILSDFD